MVTLTRVLVLAMLLGGAATLCAREADEPLAILPADTLVCWYGQPFPDTRPGESDSPINVLLDVGTSLARGPLDARAQLTLRGVELLGHMVRHPYALALVDARARPSPDDPESSRVDRLRIAMVVNTRGDSEAFLRVIQKVVNEQTGADFATLEQKTAFDCRYQELRDKRLPEWSVIAWGQIGKHWVLTIGEDLWPELAAVAAGERPSLAGDPWMRSIRDKRGTPQMEIVLAAELARQRLDPLVDGRASDFFAAWDAQDLERAHWALGFEERAMYCLAHYRTAGETRVRLYADPQMADAELLATIPDRARYALYRVPAGQMLPRILVGFQAARGRDYRAAVSRWWEKLQQERGIDARTGFLDNLGERVVMHNHPRHPMQLPLAFTMLVEVRQEPELTRRTLDAMCEGISDWLTAEQQRLGRPNVIKLARDSSNLWSLSIGPLPIAAWTAGDRFIITSWSSAALREYLSSGAAPRR